MPVTRTTLSVLTLLEAACRDKPLLGLSTRGEDGQREVLFARSSRPPQHIVETLERIGRKAEELRKKVPQVFEGCQARGVGSQAIFGVDRPYAPVRFFFFLFCFVTPYFFR